MLQSEYYAKLEIARQKYDTLQHHGILGQKWGVRRFQEKDGSYTQAGRERYGYGPAREPKNDDGDKVGMGIVPAALATAATILAAEGLTTLVGDPIHNAKVSSDIRKWEENRKKEKTDPETGLKLKDNPNASVKDDMKMINREYGYGMFSKTFFGIDSKKSMGHTENCMLCTTALDLKRRGYDVKAGTSPDGYYAKDLKNWYKEKKDPTMGRFNSVIEQLNKQPEGSYGNLMVYWAEGGGHSMFYRIEDSKPVIYDAQSNKTYSISEISSHINYSLPGHCFLRTDNLTPDYEYLKKNNIIA